MHAFPTSDFVDVFRHFGVRPLKDNSDDPWAPVFQVDFAGRRAIVRSNASKSGEAVSHWCRALVEEGVRVVAPLAPPVVLDDRQWVLHPWVEGRAYLGEEDLAASGELLGRLHRGPVRDFGLRRFPWDFLPADDPADDLPRVRELFTRNAPAEAPEVMARLEPLARDFVDRTLRAMTVGGLPVVTGMYDFRAAHLVYAAGGPVLAKPDYAMVLPRILDLAGATLLFHLGVRGRRFDAGEWRVFRDAYLSVVDLTEQERRSWPDALDYVVWDEGTFLAGGDEEWETPSLRAFLLDFVTTPRDAYPLPEV